MFLEGKSTTLSFEIGINYYKTVGSSNNTAYNRNRKIYKKTIIVLT